MEPLKEMFNRTFYMNFARVFSKADTNFDTTAFVDDVTRDMESLSLNGRLRNTAVMLRKYLPGNYENAVSVLYRAAPSLPTGYTALVLPDFVALYGKDHFDLSMEALQYFTTLGSAEFAVREFLRSDLHKTLNVMRRWAEDRNVHVRRLASEGSRPRLPWSFKLDDIIRQPALTQDILERLNADPERYVRKSVANHLNDHSKDNTGYLLQLVNSWDRTNRHTAWITKHAIRSLIKKGHPEALGLFGFRNDVQVAVENLTIDKDQLRLGDTLLFGFDLRGGGGQEQKLVVDYAIHYVKSSGARSKKVFKLKELTLSPDETVSVRKKQLFLDLTTRRHYSGLHTLEILVNGQVLGRMDFELRV